MSRKAEKQSEQEQVTCSALRLEAERVRTEKFTCRPLASELERSDSVYSVQTRHSAGKAVSAQLYGDTMSC